MSVLSLEQQWQDVELGWAVMFVLAPLSHTPHPHPCHWAAITVSAYFFCLSQDFHPSHSTSHPPF